MLCLPNFSADSFPSQNLDQPKRSYSHKGLLMHLGWFGRYLEDTLLIAAGRVCDWKGVVLELIDGARRWAHTIVFVDLQTKLQWGVEN